MSLGHATFRFKPLRDVPRPWHTWPGEPIGQRGRRLLDKHAKYSGHLHVIAEDMGDHEHAKTIRATIDRLDRIATEMSDLLNDAERRGGGQ